MKLEELLESLEKAASEHAKPEEQTDKPQVSKELDALLTKEAAAENAKKAFEDGENLANAILEKLATQAVEEINAATETEAPKTEEKKDEAQAVEKTAAAKTETKVEAKPETKEDNTMNKEAQDAKASAKELANTILEKLAASQAPMVENTGTPGGHKLHQDVAKSVAQDDAKIGPMPGRNGTFNQLFDAIVAKAKAVSGPVAYDQVAANASESSQAGAEGRDKAMGTPSVGPSPDIQEKQAAVDALIEAGLDWETAVDLVKQAAEDIEREEVDQVKMAAVNELMKEGMDFDGAVDSVRKAIEDLSKEAK